MPVRQASKAEQAAKAVWMWWATAKLEPDRPGTLPRADTTPESLVDPTLGALLDRVPLLATTLVLDTHKAATMLLRAESRLDGMLPQEVLRLVTTLVHLEPKLAGMLALLVLKQATTPVLQLAKLAGTPEALVSRAALVSDTTQVSKVDKLVGEPPMPVHQAPKLAGMPALLVLKQATMLASKLVKPHGEQPTLASTLLAMCSEERILDSESVWEAVLLLVDMAKVALELAATDKAVLDSEDLPEPELVPDTKLLP